MNWYYPSVGPLPYESMFSIFIKLSHANFMEFPKLSKIANNLNLNPGVIRNWYRLRQTTELELLVPEFNNHLPFDFAPSEGLRKLRQEFAFCPVCIKFGYHSVFNVIKTHDFCVLHKCRLSVACSTCTENYFYGFRFLEPIPKLLTHCDKCGFEDIGLFKEINMRRNRHLNKALRSVGEQQAAWYSKVKYFHERCAPKYSEYYKSSVARTNLTVPFERAVEMDSPERCAQLLTDNQRIFWLQHPGPNPNPNSIPGSMFRSDSLESSLEDIERRYLTKHRECLKFANELTGYPDGCCRTGKFCAMALAYTLLRIKIIYGDWPAAGGVCASAAGFPYPGIVGLGRGDEHRELSILFLEIVGRLQFQVSQGANFAILCSSIGEFTVRYDPPFYIRRSSYAFRNMCNSSHVSLEVFRYEFGGPIYVRFPNNDSEPYGVPRERILI